MIFTNTKYGQVYCGDCLKIMKALPDNSVETLITDPPAGISFMSKGWDHHKGGRQQWIDYMAERFSEALRIIKPGGLALAWALPRTAHWTAIALEDAGWYIDTKLYHLFGCGWPKSLDISKGIDKHFGCEREKIKNSERKKLTGSNNTNTRGNLNPVDFIEPTPVHPQAKKWDGWKSQLKPMCEEWIVCRKPVDKNFVNNSLKWGVAGYNIDGCRVEMDLENERRHDLEPSKQDIDVKFKDKGFCGGESMDKTLAKSIQEQFQKGRYPGNVIIDDEVAEEMDERYGVLSSGASKTEYITKESENVSMSGKNYERPMQNRKASAGGASRFFTWCNFQEVDFFYGGKASASEKNEGCEKLPNKKLKGLNQSPRDYDGKVHGEIKTKNDHPTVKSLELCRWLCTLSKPPDGGTVLDMFAGTMSIPIAAYQTDRKFIAIEQDEEYYKIGLARLAAAMEQKRLF